MNQKGTDEAMVKALRRVRLDSKTDLMHVLEAVHADGTPCLIEREGERLAVVIHPEDYDPVLMIPSAEGKARALSAAGAWKDLDADELLERVYRARHE